MSLGDFFRNNLPYGMARNEKGQWQAFNREYMPLGFTRMEAAYDLNKRNDLPIQTKYRGLTNKFILNLVDNSDMVTYDENGDICRFRLYTDDSNPINKSTTTEIIRWELYFEKLKKLSKLNEKSEY